MTKQSAVNYWTKTADEDVITAETLLTTRRYVPCLFFCHLALEKIAKAVYVARHEDAAPWTHDVLRLLRESAVEIPDQTATGIREINRFNIQARYDDYKRTLYKTATKSFTTIWFSKAKEIFLWIKQQI